MKLQLYLLGFMMGQKVLSLFADTNL